MSSSALPRTPAPTSPMRQQLDELDALLQRMLSLPVNQLNEPSSDPPSPTSPAPVERARTKVGPPVERRSVPQTPTVEKQQTPSPRVEQEQSLGARSESPDRVRGPITVFQPLSSPGTLTVVTPRTVAQEPESGST